MQNFFRAQRPCDILTSEMGPSRTGVGQIPHFKIMYIRFNGFKVPSDDLFSVSSRYVSKYSQSDYKPGSSKVQSIYTHTELHIQQFHTKEWEQNHKFLKVCYFV